MTTTIDLIKAHTSKRAYSDQAVDGNTLKTIINAGQHAASSSFIQAYCVINVVDADKRMKIAAAAGGQTWVENAPVFMVWCADLTRVEYASVSQDRGKLDGYTEHFLAATVDVALAAQTSLIAAESMGLGGVFIGGIRNDPQLVVDLLKLPHNVYPVFGMCLGYPLKELAVKPRFNTDDILYTDEFTANTEDIVNRYDTTMKEYYQSRGANTKLSDWSEQTTNAVQGKLRPHMLTFLQQQGFLKA